MGALETLGTSGLGSIAKALLVIHKLPEQSDSATATVAHQTELALNLTSSIGTAVSTLTGTSSALKAASLDACVMQVQYNPSSLSILANAKTIPFTYLQKNLDSGIPNQSSRPPMVVLSVELIFDAMNPKDAFMAEKYASISTGGAISSVAGAVQGEYTVQPQTDGLIAALMRPSTRMVTFRWADMAFTGQLIEVQARYTMFSVSGKPIRSIVQMNIAQQVESESDLQYWDQALDKAFDSGALDQGKSAAQTLGNLLNLDAF